MKQTMQFFDAATKFDNEGVKLRKTISGMLATAKQTKRLEVRKWMDQAVDLTYGQAKVLYEHHCLLVMQDDNGRWFKQIPGPELTVIKAYLSSGEVK